MVILFTGREVLPVWSHRGPTPLSVYILPVHFASCALHSTSTAAKCQRGASRLWAIMENIFHPDPLELLELPHYFVQGMFKALQSCDVKWVQIMAFCCNLTLMNAHGKRKRGNKTRLHLTPKTILKAEIFQPFLYILLLNF